MNLRQNLEEPLVGTNLEGFVIPLLDGLLLPLAPYLAINDNNNIVYMFYIIDKLEIQMNKKQPPVEIR